MIKRMSGLNGDKGQIISKERAVSASSVALICKIMEKMTGWDINLKENQVNL